MTTIHLLNVFIPNVPTPIRFVFSSEERAKQAYAATFNFEGSLRLSDDFGVEVTFDTKPIARVLCDCVTELNGNIEIELLRARASMKAQKMASSDPTLSNGGSPIMRPPGGSGPVVPFPGR